MERGITRETGVTANFPRKTQGKLMFYSDFIWQTLYSLQEIFQSPSGHQWPVQCWGMVHIYLFIW